MNKSLKESLEEDLKQINNMKVFAPITLVEQDYHNDYSPERTDPCPDFFGQYSLMCNGDKINYEPLPLDVIDEIVCCIYNLAKYGKINSE